jgi:Holliday junction resolvase RusA-like endonuclease
MSKKVVLFITPQTHVRATRGDSVFFRIPREKLYPRGLERLKRLEKYNDYKVDLLTEAKKVGFTLPPCGLKITFYIPVPRTWSKKKKKLHHGIIHQSKPDIDNLTKAFLDSLVAEDKFIGNISITKRWVNYPLGWIECEYGEDEPIQKLVEVPLKDAPFSKNA